MRPKVQASDVLDLPPTSAISLFPRSAGLVKPLLLSEPGFGGCQLSGTEVRVSCFQKKLGKQERLAGDGSVKSGRGFLV